MLLLSGTVKRAYGRALLVSTVPEYKHDRMSNRHVIDPTVARRIGSDDHVVSKE